MVKKATEKILTLDDIKEAEDVTERTVPVPQWGGSVIVRSITKRQMRVIKAQSRDKDGDLQEDEVEKQLFLQGLVSPAVTEEDYEMFLDKSSAAVDTITKAIIGTSKLDDEAVTKQEKTFPRG